MVLVAERELNDAAPIIEVRRSKSEANIQPGIRGFFQWTVARIWSVNFVNGLFYSSTMMIMSTFVSFYDFVEDCSIMLGESACDGLSQQNNKKCIWVSDDAGGRCWWRNTPCQPFLEKSECPTQSGQCVWDVDSDHCMPLHGLSSNLVALLVPIYILGCICGNWVAPYLLERIGHQTMLRSLCVYALILDIIFHFATWWRIFPLLVVIRFALGLSGGMVAVTTPNYVHLMAPLEHKTYCGLMMQFGMSLGLTVTASIAVVGWYSMQRTTGSPSIRWRLQAIDIWPTLVVCIMLCITFLAPPSPIDEVLREKKRLAKLKSNNSTLEKGTSSLSFPASIYQWFSNLCCSNAPTAAHSSGSASGKETFAENQLSPSHPLLIDGATMGEEEVGGEAPTASHSDERVMSPLYQTGEVDFLFPPRSDPSFAYYFDELQNQLGVLYGRSFCPSTALSYRPPLEPGHGSFADGALPPKHHRNASASAKNLGEATNEEMLNFSTTAEKKKKDESSCASHSGKEEITSFNDSFDKRLTRSFQFSSSLANRSFAVASMVPNDKFVMSFAKPFVVETRSRHEPLSDESSYDTHHSSYSSGTLSATCQKGETRTWREGSYLPQGPAREPDDNEKGMMQMPGALVRAYGWIQMLPRIGIGLLVAGSYQLVGTSAIFMYAPSITKNVGLNPFLGGLSIGLMCIVGSFIVLGITNRFSMRMMVLLGTIMDAFLIAMAGLVTYPGVAPENVKKVVSLIAVCLYILIFVVCIGSCYWIMTQSLFPISFRSRGGSVMNMTLLTLHATILITFPILVEKLSGGVGMNQDKGLGIIFFAFGGFGVFFTVMLYFTLHPWKEPS